MSPPTPEGFSHDLPDHEVSEQSIRDAWDMITSMELVEYEEGRNLVHYFTLYRIVCCEGTFQLPKAYHIARAIYRLPHVQQMAFLHRMPTSWKMALDIARKIDIQGIRDFLRAQALECPSAKQSHGTSNNQAQMFWAKGSSSPMSTWFSDVDDSVYKCKNTAKARASLGLDNPVEVQFARERQKEATEFDTRNGICNLPLPIQSSSKHTRGYPPQIYKWPYSSSSRLREGPDTQRQTARYDGYGLAHLSPHQIPVADLRSPDAMASRASPNSRRDILHPVYTSPLTPSLRPAAYQEKFASISPAAPLLPNNDTTEVDHSTNTDLETDASSTSSWDLMLDDRPGQ